MKKLVLYIVYTFVLSTAAQAAACVDRAALLRAISKSKLQEQRVGLGMSSNGGMIEVYSGPKSFTIIVTNPRTPNVSCIVAASKGSPWLHVPIVTKDTGA